jgi:hypothetical protein
VTSAGSRRNRGSGLPAGSAGPPRVLLGRRGAARDDRPCGRPAGPVPAERRRVRAIGRRAGSGSAPATSSTAWSTRWGRTPTSRSTRQGVRRAGRAAPGQRPQRALIVIAPHGGDIERHTDEQADQVASRLVAKAGSSWRCKGWKGGAGALVRWHITSTDVSAPSFPRLDLVISRGFTHASPSTGSRTPRSTPTSSSAAARRRS